MDSNTSDTDLDQFIADAIKGDKISLDLLRFHPWVTKRLAEISEYKAYQYRDYGIEAAEIRDAVFDALDKIESIQNPNKRPLTQCLTAWCWVVANNFCLNEIRHIGVERNYSDNVAARESIQGTRRSTEGGSISLRSSDSNSPEKIALEKEIVEHVHASLYFEVKRELANSSPAEIRIVILWGAGKMTNQQISDFIGMPVATVNRHLTEWHKRVIKRTTLVQPVVKEDPQHLRGAYALIRDAITEHANAV